MPTWGHPADVPLTAVNFTLQTTLYTSLVSTHVTVWTHSLPLLYPLSSYAVPMPIVRTIFLCRLGDGTI